MSTLEPQLEPQLEPMLEPMVEPLLVAAGKTNRKVWLRTLMSAIVCSISGMWRETHSLALDPAL